MVLSSAGLGSENGCVGEPRNNCKLQSRFLMRRNKIKIKIKIK
jgi:hypothetical protein